MHVVMASFHGNPNVGLYAYCTQHAGRQLCLIGERLSQELEQEITQALGAELHHVRVAGTTMPGVFIAGNSKALLLPAIAFESEIEALRRLGLTVHTIGTKLTCLGNNIIANDHGALVHPEFTDKEVEEIAKHLGVPAKRMRIAGIDTPGSCVVLNGRHGIIHRDAAEFEIEMVRSTLKLDSLEPASVNLGSPYIRSGIISAPRGFVVGNQSGGPEVVHIDQSLGYLG